MRSKSIANLYMHVKVEVRSRSPILWGWNVQRDGSGVVVQKSERLFSYSEDAWREGQQVLAGMASD